MCELAMAKSEKKHDILAAVFRMPEIYIGGEYSFAADIWSLGVTVIETILGFDKSFGMKNDNLETLNKQIVSTELSFLI